MFNYSVRNKKEFGDEKYIYNTLKVNGNFDQVIISGIFKMST